MATGIPPSVWEAEDERAIVTAIDLLTDNSSKPDTGPGGVRMSG